MLLNREVQLMVFNLGNDGTFDNIGEISQFSSLMWPDSYNEYSTFELWAPITDDNAELIKEGNIIWAGGDNAAMIEVIGSKVDDKGQTSYNVKGRTLEMLLTTRILWGDTYTKNDYASTIMYDIVDKNCINPTDIKRKIPFLSLSSDPHVGGQITYQKTGGEVYDSIHNIATSQDIGFRILFRPKEKKLIFEVFEGVDRTIGQSINDPVEFSTDLEDIIESDYYKNGQDYKCIAVVAGEDSGTNRKKVVVGDQSVSGFNRKEMYVDARDLQSTVTDESGGQQQLTPAQYEQTLIQRGEEKLSENKVVETFEAKIRVFGDIQYEYNVDYRKGDKVTIIDNTLNVMVSARITATEEVYDDEYSLELTFGYSYPTIAKKIKQKIG